VGVIHGRGQYTSKYGSRSQYMFSSSGLTEHRQQCSPVHCYVGRLWKVLHCMERRKSYRPQSIVMLMNSRCLTIIISGFTGLLRTWMSHTGDFVILLRHLVGLLWTIDQFVAVASSNTGQHNTETQRQTSMPRAEFEPTTPVTKRKTYILDRAATGTGSFRCWLRWNM
jgi:hypothetical protein